MSKSKNKNEKEIKIVGGRKGEKKDKTSRRGKEGGGGGRAIKSHGKKKNK